MITPLPEPLEPATHDTVVGGLLSSSSGCVGLADAQKAIASKPSAKSQALPKEKAKAKSKAKAQARAPAPPSREPQESEGPFQKLYIAKATTPARMYVQGRMTPQSPKVLVVEVTRKQSEHYEQICTTLKQMCENEGLTKTAARERKALLISMMG
jgi:hypothetical protein